MQTNMMKHKLNGGIIALIGYLLSPLSWWNDLILNIPLAYLFGSFFGLFTKKLFLPTFVLGYWLTNIAGFILMHHGMTKVVKSESSQYSKNDLLKDFIWSILYTVIVIILVKLGWLKFPLEYFK